MPVAVENRGRTDIAFRLGRSAGIVDHDAVGDDGCRFTGNGGMSAKVVVFWTMVTLLAILMQDRKR